MPPINYPIALPYFPPEEIDRILSQYRKILQGDDLLSMGPRVAEFEKAFADYSGVPFAVATNSCSAALEIALRMMDLKNGDEVILPAETFIATGTSVVREGGKVVFAEINPDTFCLAAEDLKKKITKKTKAVIIVHMAGLITPEIYKIKKICQENNILLIEDAAHAPGATLDGSKAGTFGDAACFSFYPTKVMTTAEGGMLLTKNKDLYEKANSFRNRGLDMSADKEIYLRSGTNNRMTELAAILGLSQLKCLDSFIDQRNKIAKIYSESLLESEKTGLASPLPLPPNSRHSYWRYIVRIKEKIDRTLLKKKMAEAGIALDWAYDPPLHLQPLFKNLYGISEGHLPVTEKMMNHFVCLPIHPGIGEEDAQFIVSTFKKIGEELIN